MFRKIAEHINKFEINYEMARLIIENSSCIIIYFRTFVLVNSFHDSGVCCHYF